MMTQEKNAVSLNSEGLIQLWFDCFSFGLTADGVYDGWLTLGPTVYNAYILVYMFAEFGIEAAIAWKLGPGGHAFVITTFTGCWCEI